MIVSHARRIRRGLAAAVVVLLAAAVWWAGGARTELLAANTLFLAGATSAVSLPVGTMLAVLLVRTNMPGRQLGVGVLLWLLVVPLYVQTAAWQAGFGLQGWYTFAGADRVWLEGMRGAVVVHSAAALPWTVLIVGAALRLVDRDQEEAALMDLSTVGVFRRVTLRGAMAGVACAALWIVVVTAGEIAVADQFLVRTYAEEVYTELAVAPSEAPLGALLGAAVTGALVVAVLLTLGELMPVVRQARLRRPMTFQLGPWRWPSAALGALVLGTIVLVPIGDLAWKAGVVVSQEATGRVRSWSATKCLEIVASSPLSYTEELAWSLGLAALAATAALVIGTALAWTARRGDRRAIPAVGVVALSMAVPGPLVGLAAIYLLDRPELPPLAYLFDHSITAPLAVQTFRALPLVTIILWYALRGVGEDTLDAATIDGLGSAARLWRVALPQRKAAAGAAWLVAFAVSFGEFSASVLVVPPGVTTLPIRISGLLHYGYEDNVAGICLAMLVGLMPVACAVGWLARRASLPNASS